MRPQGGVHMSRLTFRPALCLPLIQNHVNISALDPYMSWPEWHAYEQARYINVMCHKHE